LPRATITLPAGREQVPGIQPNDRVVVRTGYAQGVIGVVRHVYDFNGERRYSVDYEAVVLHEHNAYVGGDYPEASLEPAGEDRPGHLIAANRSLERNEHVPAASS
jgi:hypothetical protein